MLCVTRLPYPDIRCYQAKASGGNSAESAKLKQLQKEYDALAAKLNAAEGNTARNKAD